MNDRKWKKGDVHPETGMVFWSMKNNKTREQWYSKEVYDKRCSKHKEYQESEEGKEYQRQWYLRNKEKKKQQGAVNLIKRLNEVPLKFIFGTCYQTWKQRKKKMEFSIDYEFIEELWNKQEGKCFYTKVKMEYCARKKNPYQISIDRIDSNIGYTKENTVLCCQAINFMKNDYSLDEFNDFLEAIKLIKDGNSN